MTRNRAGREINAGRRNAELERGLAGWWFWRRGWIGVKSWKPATRPAVKPKRRSSVVLLLAVAVFFDFLGLFIVDPRDVRGIVV